MPATAILLGLAWKSANDYQSIAKLSDLPAILVALCLSLLVTVPLCGWMMQRLARRIEQRVEGGHE